MQEEVGVQYMWWHTQISIQAQLMLFFSPKPELW